MTAPTNQPIARPLAFFIKNHSSNQLFSEPFDEFIQRSPHHFEFEGSKPKFLEWCHDSATEHAFFSFFEPEHREARTTRDNPAGVLHGIVADYDAVIDCQMLEKSLKKMPADFPVAYASSTFSGGARLVWLFEKPLNLFGYEHAKSLLRALQREMKLKTLLPGFDEPAFLDSARYFELGRDWKIVNSGARVSSKLLEHSSYQAAQNQDFSAHGAAIPIDVIAAEVERKYPGRWQGPFTVGAQGVRFWDTTATNPKGAWIRETGIVAFSGEGRFLPWAEVLGHEFVRKYDQDRIVSAVGDVYFEGNGRYWRRVQGEWRCESAETLRRHLIAKGLSDRSRGASHSEVNRALHTIEDTRRIDGAAPFLYSDKVLVHHENHTYLNTARARPVMPEHARHEWGQGFPWVANFIDRLFPDDEQRSVFLSWMSRFYRGAIDQCPRQGQVLVVAGPAGAGKTMLSSKIIAPLMGGSQEATLFLTGADKFNDKLFESPVWTVDDATGAADRRAHTVWTEMLKKIAANRRHACRAMYQSAVTIEFLGRVVVTLNEDDESAEMLPALDRSAGDKFIFLLASSTKDQVDFGKAGEILGELPAFGAFLRDFVVPEHLCDSHRYGVVSFKHPQLVRKSADNSPAAEFIETLDYWRSQYFNASDDNNWTGGAVDLIREFYNNASLEHCRRAYSAPKLVGRLLKQAVRQDTPWIEEMPRHGQLGVRYKVHRPDQLTPDQNDRCVRHSKVSPLGK